MPSISAHVAWAVPVHPVELGAHFEAYTKLKPTILTLRLCNRFGKGGEGSPVGVARLPVELVNAVEDVLMREECEVRREEWGRDFRCWSSECRPLDHFTNEEAAELWHEYADGPSCEEEQCEWEEDCGWKCEHEIKGLNTKERSLLDEWMDGFNRPFMFGSWQADNAHFDRRACWVEKVTEDILSKTSKAAFRKQFGLDVWMSLSHRTYETERGPRLEADGESTIAYLVLPRADGFDVKLEREWDEGGIQSGHGLVIAPPTHPSEASLRRFPRAMKMLGLTPPALHTSGNGVEEGQRSISSKETGSSDSVKDNSDLAVPRLRLLVSSNIEYCC